MTTRPGALVLLRAVVAALVIPHWCSAAEKPEEIRARFLADYGPAASTVGNLYTNYEVKSRAYRFANGEKLYFIPRSMIVSPAGWKITSTQNVAGKDKINVMAANKDYGFKAVEGDGAFIVTEVAGRNGFIGRPCSQAYWDWESGRSYLDIAQDAKFTPISYSDAVFQGTACKAYCTSYIRMDIVLGKQQFDKTFYFDQNNSWVCVGWHGGPMEERNTYRRVEGFPAPALATTSIWGFGDHGDSICNTGTEVTEFRAIPEPAESEFRLTSIGLSEPVNPRKPKSWWNWYLIAAGALLAATVAIWYVRRRSRKAAGHAHAASPGI